MSEPALKPDRRPESGAFELTVRCNLHCKMCLFRHDDSENEALIAGEKTAAEWIGIDMARQAAEAGTVSLTITGGEPLLRKDFPQIWEGLSKIGFILTLYTNATLVNPELMDLFRRYPPHRIGVTLYGASEDTYEKVTGSGKACRQTLDGIKLLSTLPSLLDFRTTIIKDNLADMDEMEEWVKQNFGKDRMLSHTKMVLSPVRGGTSQVSACRLGPEDNIRLYLRRHAKPIRDAIGADRFDISSMRIRMTKNDQRPTAMSRLTLYGCDAGMKTYAITHDGQMIACQVLSRAQTDPFLSSFRTAWDALPQQVKRNTVDEHCMACENADYCLSCCATRYAEAGDPWHSSDYICKNTIELTRFIDEEMEAPHEERLFFPDCGI